MILSFDPSFSGFEETGDEGGEWGFEDFHDYIFSPAPRYSLIEFRGEYLPLLLTHPHQCVVNHFSGTYVCSKSKTNSIRVWSSVVIADLSLCCFAFASQYRGRHTTYLHGKRHSCQLFQPIGPVAIRASSHPQPLLAHGRIREGLSMDYSLLAFLYLGQ